MENTSEKTSYFFYGESRPRSGSGQGQTNETLKEISERIGADGYEGTRHEAFVWEICLIIWDVLQLPADCFIKIGRHNRPASAVQSVYRMLTYEHLIKAVNSFSGIGYKIRSPKAYIRTLLYNSVFELEAEYLNQYSLKPKDDKR